MDVLQIEHLSKSFGPLKVIDDISLSVPEGAVFGFLGENGAGKTTTMKMALGLLRPDGGSVSVCGRRVRYGYTATNRHIGYLPDVPAFYPYMRPKEYLRLCGRTAGLSDVVIAERSCRLLELVGLNKVHKKIGSFSRGMKQRLGVAQALINEPKLLICDEPTSALDPVGRKEILDILRQIHGQTTVVFSTHILSDVERICDRAAVLHGGKIVLEGTLDELRARHRTDALLIEFAAAGDKARFMEAAGMNGSIATDGISADGAIVNGAFDAPAGTDLLDGHEEAGLELTLHAKDVAAAQRAVLRICTEHDILPARFEVLAPSMENLFLEAVQ
ncbi:MAG: ABC transporter ATP-binding protein [Oscillospiraceae bacterium]|nr:ABC transporter ATP-binding protein [Oscillospiraceae bacterium]